MRFYKVSFLKASTFDIKGGQANGAAFFISLWKGSPSIAYGMQCFWINANTSGNHMDAPIYAKLCPSRDEFPYGG